MDSLLPLIEPLLDPLLFLVDIVLRLCFVVASFYFARLKGRRAWLWCPLVYIFSIFALLPLVSLPPTEAAKRSQDTDELEADTTEAQHLPGSQPERHAPGGQLGAERADAERILELSATLPLDDGREIAVLGAKLRREQEFLALQREFGDKTERVIETQDRIDALKQRISAKYEQVLPESAVDFKQVDSREFVELVARLYKRMGYTVARTPRTRDGGVDLYARRKNVAGVEEIAVRCQHSYSSVVGVAAARALYTAVSAEQRLARGILVTSGSFSTWCRSFAEGKPIDLIDRERLRELLEHYQVR